MTHPWLLPEKNARRRICGIPAKLPKRNPETDTEDLNTIIKEDTSKNSSGATLNTERLAQDDSYTIISQTLETKRNDELLNETSVGSADQSRQVAPGEVITMGENAMEAQEDLGIVMGTEADVTDEDLLSLGDKEQDMDGGDDEMYNNAGLDDTDFDGEPLNEAASDMSTTGEDLDMPEEAQNNPKRKGMDQGDEENDYYSLGSDNNDEVVEGTP
ncbi:MAG: hypothetical protein EOO04_27015 [Chitinophagaceae bacterium]|nr:MAG: hypothetical protein EOO04_27015 [Chitinophagaceae bacterium]